MVLLPRSSQGSGFTGPGIRVDEFGRVWSARSEAERLKLGVDRLGSQTPKGI